MYADNESFETFLTSMLVPLLRTKYSSNPCISALDPSNPRDSWQGITPKERFAEYGLVATTEISNSPKTRIQCVSQMLNQYSGGLLISPACELLIRGFESDYRYRRLRAAGSIGAVYTEQPEKTEASHPMDSLQYACLLISKGLGAPDDGFIQASDAVRRHRRKLARIV